jgi:uncharacterized protein with GYD domain
MPKYMIQAKFTPEALQGTIEEGGTARHAAVEEALESIGGSLEAYYYTFGEYDVLGIADMPSNAAAAGFALAIAHAGGATGMKTTVLLEPSEIDEAVKSHPDYRPPGHVAAD